MEDGPAAGGGQGSGDPFTGNGCTLRTSAGADRSVPQRGDPMESKDDVNRREFLAATASGLALTIVPRHVLGGAGYTAPSDKLTLANIGCGTQGIREMLRLLPAADVQITAVCDPVKDGTNYVDWDATGIRDSVRKFLEAPSWGEGVTGIRAGRDMAKEIIDTC